MTSPAVGAFAGAQPAPPVTARPVRGEADFWRVRELLIRTVPLAPAGFNWDVRRWDGKYFYDPRGAWSPEWAAKVCLWESADGELVAAAHPEGAGDAYLEVHPDYRHLEAEMLAWAEAHLAAPGSDGRRQLTTFVFEHDALRQRLLAERGYERMPSGGMLRHMRVGRGPLPEPAIAPGYTLRTTQPADPADCGRIADLLNAAFRRDFHNAAEYQAFARLAPCFRGDLDLVAVAPDGSFAAYVGVPYDETNRRGIFEPVCTHPDHQRRGLARALMLEGLHRLRALGAQDATVDTGDMLPANRLYDGMGFTEAYRGYEWRKLLP